MSLNNTLVYSQEIESDLTIMRHRVFPIEVCHGIKKHVGKILKEKFPIRVNARIQMKRKTSEIIHFIVTELLDNAFHSVKEKELSVEGYQKKVSVNIYYNEEPRCFTIIVEDNGKGLNAYPTEKKSRERIKWVRGGKGIGQERIRTLPIVDKYEKTLSEDGAVIKVRVNLDKKHYFPPEIETNMGE